MCEAVRTANAEFYRAFEALSIEAMESIWSHQDDVRCVHPGWDALCGWEAVQKSWAGIFDSARQAGTYMEFNVTDIQL
jgi:ketosteroid isomerase-like protein